VRTINELGGHAETVDAGPTSVDALVARIVEEARPGDVVVLLSNGAFGGIHGRLVRAFEARAASTEG